MPAPSALHRKVAASLCRQLYAQTEQLLENGPSFQGYCDMHDALVKKEIPRTWPKVKSETLARISIALPAVNYISGNRASDSKRIAQLLAAEIPTTVAPVKKVKARATAAKRGK